MKGFLTIWHRWRAWRLRERGDRLFKSAARCFDRAVDHDFAAANLSRPKGEGEPPNPQPP